MEDEIDTTVQEVKGFRVEEVLPFTSVLLLVVYCYYASIVQG